MSVNDCCIENTTRVFAEHRKSRREENGTRKNNICANKQKMPRHTLHVFFLSIERIVRIGKNSDIQINDTVEHWRRQVKRIWIGREQKKIPKY